MDNRDCDSGLPHPCAAVHGGASNEAQNRLLHRDSLRGGLTAGRSLYPFWGITQESRGETISRGRFVGFRLAAVPVEIYYGAVLAAAAFSTAGALSLKGEAFGSPESLGKPWVLVGLAVAAAIAERGRVRLMNNVEESISLLPTLFAAVLLGPLAAMVVGAASMVGRFGRPYLGWHVWTSIRSVTGAMAGLVAMNAGHLTANRFASIAIATALGALTAETLDVAFAAFTYRLRRKGHMLAVVRTLAPLIFASVPLYAPVVALLALAYQEVSAWTLPLFFVPALAAQRTFVLYQQQRRLTDDLSIVNQQLERANLSFAAALVTTLDARDRYTAGHSAAVALYARDIAKQLGLSEDQQQLAHLCGLVHDIGKIGLPVGLLEKPGKLTLDERRQMEEHSAIGERILGKVEDYAEIAAIVRHHHERWDGRGYPDGIASTDIPLVARIIAVADAYNAMTSDRPYRDAMPSRVARLRLAHAVESQFDSSVVAAFEAILADASQTYREGTRPDFTFGAQDRYTDSDESVAAVA